MVTLEQAQNQLESKRRQGLNGRNRWTRVRRLAGRWCIGLLMLGGLGALLVPNFIRCSCQGPLTACKSNLKNIGIALEMYSTDHSGKYPGSLSALVPEYLKQIPVCGAAGYSTYRACFGRNAPSTKAMKTTT